MRGGSTVFPPPVQSKPKPKPLTKAQKPAKALKACAKDKHKQKRKTCGNTARGKYGPAKKQTKKKG
jgi:hypothetical protein